jgi:pyruvate dehydrogenase E2 component (dihydrolipoamide acetyltransferase)
LGESTTEATLTQWLNVVGDEVKRGDVLAEVETDKAIMPLECPANGVLLALLVDEGATVAPGELLAVVGQPTEKWEGRKETEPKTILRETRSLADSQAPDHPNHKQAPERRRVSPGARRLAQRLGIDIDVVQPEVPGARVTTGDVERYAASAKAGEPGEQEGAAGIPSHRVTLSRVRKVVADRMAESARTIPQFSVTVEADAVHMLALQEELTRQSEQSGVKVSLTALLVNRTARALAHHPLMNARFDGEDIVVFDTVNIAVATATLEGLMVPVIHGVEGLSVLDIARRLTRISAAARQGKLSPADVADATFTISNMGMFGVTQFVPLVNPPQAAILGVGAARPAILPSTEGEPHQVQLMSLTVSADHRVLDGGDVAQFLIKLKGEIER